MPCRDLPEEFPPKDLASSWVDTPWWQYGDANKVTDYYSWSLDELMLAARLGFDGIGTNEHHQNPYGFMCNPNLFGATLAKLTRDQELDHVVLVQARSDHLVFAANPGCRRIRGPRLPQRRSANRWFTDWPRERCFHQLRRHPHGASRAISGRHRFHAQSLDSEGFFCLERKILSVPEGESVASASSKSSPPS
jgi:hypothetical protein